MAWRSIRALSVGLGNHAFQARSTPPAGVAELVDALDLGSSDESCGGSNPSARTTPQTPASAKPSQDTSSSPPNRLPLSARRPKSATFRTGMGELLQPSVDKGGAR